ncbi:MAG: kinase-like domain-containing protein [Monoraphidium minutum]|nr:MAG: kinase-like domain-containing protein [Monoraphidium minutum]
MKKPQWRGLFGKGSGGGRQQAAHEEQGHMHDVNEDDKPCCSALCSELGQQGSDSPEQQQQQHPPAGGLGGGGTGGAVAAAAAAPHGLDTGEQQAGADAMEADGDGAAAGGGAATAPGQQQQQQQPEQQQQTAAAPGEADSSVIAIAEHCPAALSRDNWSLDVFEIRAKMYSGHISSVYRAVHRTSGITVGLKMYRRGMLNDMERHQIAREIWLHIQLNHPSIIALYAAWKDRDYIYLVLEWAPEGNVFTFLQQHGGRLPEHVAVPMVLEPTMSALSYIHGLGMIHRDVKPENILLTTSMQIKLADFGLSIHSNYEVANTRLGTIDYLSPEILDCPVKQHPADHKANPNKWYTNKVDCWSVGVLAYELLAGHTPFEARTPQETLYKIKSQEVAYPPSLSPGAADFIQRALVRAPEQRTGMSDLLSHAWLRGHMRRAGTAPHTRGRAATAGDVSAGLSLLPAVGGGAAAGGFGTASCSGGCAGPGGALGGGAGGGAPGSLSMPGGGGGGGGWGGGARMQSSGGIAKAALLGAPACAEGHNSSCPNILHAQGYDGDAMDCSQPPPHAPGLSPLSRGAGGIAACGAGSRLVAGGGGAQWGGQQRQDDGGADEAEAMAL